MSGETQTPAHATCPAGQLVAQVPAAHTSPAPHATPADGPTHPAAAPQCARSVSGSMQDPPHASSLAGHPPVHDPA